MVCPNTTKVLNPLSERLSSLPPSTKAQVAYWGELARRIALKGPQGMGDSDWEAGLAPTRPTLRAMEERGLVVRRKRAWHCKRDWRAVLAQLQALAVATPRLVVADAPAPGLPTYAELETWEVVANWLDVQPGRKARYPFPGLDIPFARLERMRSVRLVQHRRGCYWQIFSGWKERLRELWCGVLKAETEQEEDERPEPVPLIVAAGVDTWYLNVLDTEGLPLKLRQLLDDLQRQAQDEEGEVELTTHFDGMPLFLYRTGLSSAQGGGVSWSYLLRNESITILLRRTPLNGIVAQLRLGSECLWRLTPSGALAAVQVLFRRWWAAERREVRYQVSQIHLAVDVAGVNLEQESMRQYVTRSRKGALHRPSTSDLVETAGQTWDPMAEQDALFGDMGMLTFASDPWEERAPSGWGNALELLGVNEPEEVEDRAQIVNTWGKRVSGITWSPGGAASMVLYDKTLQQRLSGKTHMVPIWEGAGWQQGELVVRHEGRLRREVLAELETAAGERGCFDDPQDCLDHLQDLLAYMVGRPPESQTCPEETDVAWIRRVVPQADDATHRSRWPTEPTWQVVQGATFTDAAPEVRRLIRRKRTTDALDGRVKTLYGALVSCAALTHTKTSTLDISVALHDVVPLLEKESIQPQKEFSEMVRQRRRKWGKPVLPEPKVLPIRADVLLDQPEPEHLDAPIPPAEKELEQLEWLIANAERRVMEAERAYLNAQTNGMRGNNGTRFHASEQQLDHLAAWIAFERAEQTKLVGHQAELMSRYASPESM
ncbi:MAG: hypothetical protein H0X24_04745 [Ktedonobacterales bacterium]|nr:hypothetical protein [Ktedonobacterales bacterium]